MSSHSVDMSSWGKPCTVDTNFLTSLSDIATNRRDTLMKHWSSDYLKVKYSTVQQAFGCVELVMLSILNRLNRNLEPLARHKIEFFSYRELVGPGEEGSLHGAMVFLLRGSGLY